MAVKRSAPTPDEAARVRVVRPNDRVPDTASGAMLREAAIAGSVVGSKKIWVGYVELGPGLVSAVHHHGSAESAIFIISGRARFYAGDGLTEIHDAQEGDFIWVPPNVVHVEMNLSEGQLVRMVVARSSQKTLVYNLPAPEGWAPSTREG